MRTTHDVDAFVELTVRFHLTLAVLAADRVLAGYLRDVLTVSPSRA